MGHQCLIGLLIWASSSTGWAQAAYTLQALEPLPGFDRSCASGINDLGLIVGYVDKEPAYPSLPVAVLWQDGQVFQIDTRGHTGAAVAVNRHGRVVGTMAQETDGRERAFSYRQRAGQLHVLPGKAADAQAINDRGTIVGVAHDKFGNPRPYVYEGGVMTLLRNGMAAVGINNAGAVVTLGDWSEGDGDSYVYENGKVTPIPNTFARGINESGAVAGWAYGADGAHAALFRHGDLQLLPNPEGIKHCYGWGGLNDDNVVVGFCDDGYSRIAAIWRNGKAEDLFKLVTDGSAVGWEPATVTGVNRSGQVIGCGWRRAGAFTYWVRRGFLLNPVR